MSLYVPSGDAGSGGFPTTPTACAPAAGITVLTATFTVGMSNTCIAVTGFFFKMTDGTCAFPTTNAPIIAQRYDTSATCNAANGTGWIAVTPNNACVSNMQGSTLVSATKVSGTTPSIAYGLFADATCTTAAASTATLATTGACSAMSGALAGSVKAYTPAVYTPAVNPVVPPGAQLFTYRVFTDAACSKSVASASSSGYVTFPTTGTCSSFKDPLASYAVYATTTYVTATKQETVSLYSVNSCSGTPASTKSFKIDGVCTNDAVDNVWYTANMVVASGASSTAVSCAAALVIAVAAAAGLRA